MKSERLQFILAALFLLLLSVALFAPALFQGQMLWGGDIQTVGLPFNIAAGRSLAQHQWPLWMPDLLGGMPGIAATNLIFLHPVDFLIALSGLPAQSGFGLDACLEVFLSGLGMLCFLRRLGLSLQASLLGALFFCMSGSQISLIFAGHTNNLKAIAMIPWIFWAAHRGQQEKRLLGWALCGLALALQILAIGMQIFAYTILGLAAFSAWMAWKEGWSQSWKRACLGLAVAAVFCALLSAPQLGPSLAYKPYSWREGFSYDSFTSWSFPPKESLGWIVPGFFGWRQPDYHGDWPFCLTTEYFGLLPWALAFAACAARLKEARGIARFFVGLAAASFIIGIGKWTPLHYLFYHLPIYSGFRSWARFLCLLTFSVSVLAAFGWDALFSGSSRALALKGALFFCALALLLSLACLGTGDALGRASAARALGLSLAAGALFWFLSRNLKWGALALAAALGLHTFDQSEVARRYLEFKDPAQILQRPDFLQALPSPDSTEPWRLLEAQGVWDQNAGILYGYESLLGYEGVQMAGPMRLQQAMQNRQIDWLSLMNVRYVLSRSPLQGLPLLRDGAVKVYANPGALPRAWLLNKSVRVADDDAAFKLLADPSFNPRLEAALGQDLALGSAAKAEGSVTWIKRTRNAFSLEVLSKQDALLVVSNMWYPAWKVKVDGARQPLLKADGCLQAVALKAGKHQLEFYYDGILLKLGCAACLLGLGLLFALWKREKGRYNLENLGGL